MRRVVREGGSQLLGHPEGCGALGHVEVEDPSSPVVDREPDVEELEADGRHDEEVHPSHQVAMISKKGGPALLAARIGLGLGEVTGDRGEPHPDSELRQLGLDLPGTPAVLGGHANDESLGLLRDGWPSGARGRDRAPVGSEAALVPADHCLGLNDDQDALPAGPESRESDPEGSINRRDPRPRMAASVDRELLAQGELDNGLIPAAAEQSGAALDDRDLERDHHPHHRGHSALPRGTRRD